MSTQTPSRSQRPMSDQPTMNRPISDARNMQGYDMDMSDQQMSDQRMMPGRRGGRGRPGSETKPAFLTTEFYVFLAAVGGVIAASVIIGNDNAGIDVFRADRAWFFIALLSIGYMLSRGLAKAGSKSRWRGDDR
ncbi:hypothetical protein OG792_09335 [Micromonospora sp. NBC_01699]|uniref:hypothetical protein n=1 Tax=Micromonospora sp. NBC_01699 TaxID=2975984 RepID=UPI002E37ED9A|nr:hypothetical protein [Micromonospora sp. NBC_01699]